MNETDTFHALSPADLAGWLEDEIAARHNGLHTPLMIWGPPGIGKSELVATAARNHGLPLIDLRLSQLEPSDLRGIPFRAGDRVEWAPPATLPHEDRHGPDGILFLDELTAALPTVAAAAYQLVLDRRLGDYLLPPGWLIVAAGNRTTDRGIAFGMPAPLANRFQHAALTVDVAQWIAWAEANGVDRRIRKFLADDPRWLSTFDPDQDQVAFASPRSWVFADRVLKKSPHQVPGPGLRARLAGCVGYAAASAFIEALAEDAGPIEAVWDDPPRAAELDLHQQWRLRERLQVRLERGQTSPETALEIATAVPDIAVALAIVRALRERHGPELYALEAFGRFCAERGEVLTEQGDDGLP
ncbi:MAG: AAA family ATPase [Halothiobacillaceae bacterium]